MTQTLLHRANRDIKPLADEATVDDMLRILVEMPPQAQEGLWIRDNEGGQVCLFGHENFPGKVIEYVAGEKDDSITSLYSATSIFDSRSNLMALRKDLISEIKAATMTINDSFTLFDGGRERHVKLKEMGTAQLIDTVTKIRKGA